MNVIVCLVCIVWKRGHFFKPRSCGSALSLSFAERYRLGVDEAAAYANNVIVIRRAPSAVNFRSICGNHSPTSLFLIVSSSAVFLFTSFPRLKTETY